MVLPELLHRVGERGFVGEIGANQREIGFGARLVEPYDSIGVLQGRGQRTADIPGRPGDENDGPSIVRHTLSRSILPSIHGLTEGQEEVASI